MLEHQDIILDEPSRTTTVKEWRSYYLGVEFLLYAFLLLGIGTYEFSSDTIVFAVALLAIFYFVIPILKKMRGEIGFGLMLLYFLQALIPLILLPKLNFYSIRNEFYMVGLGALGLVFILLPNVEIRKYKASWWMHLPVTLMGVALGLGYLGVIFKIEYFPYFSELMLGGLALGGSIFVVFVLALFMGDKANYLKYYLPRLLLMFCVVAAFYG